MFGFSEFVHDVLQERRNELREQERIRIYTIIQGNKTLAGEDLLNLLKGGDGSNDTSGQKAPEVSD